MKPVSQKLVNEEMRRLMDGYSSMELGLSPFEWVTVIGLLQLALRHPGLDDATKRMGLQAGARIQAMVAEASDGIGQMIETGWHERFDAPRSFDIGKVWGGEIVTGVIALYGDDEAVLDVAYEVPGDYQDDRWKYECFIFGIGDSFYVCHAFWFVDFSPYVVYRICLGLLSNMKPVDPGDLAFLVE
jgi:hypothetical protein